MANDETTSGPSRGVATPSGGKLKRYTVDMPGMRPSGPGSGWQLREVIGGPVVRYDDAAAALAEKQREIERLGDELRESEQHNFDCKEVADKSLRIERRRAEQAEARVADLEREVAEQHLPTNRRLARQSDELRERLAAVEAERERSVAERDECLAALRGCVSAGSNLWRAISEGDHYRVAMVERAAEWGRTVITSARTAAAPTATEFNVPGGQGMPARESEAERVTLKGRLDIANTAYSETYVRSEEMKAERDRAVAERDELRAFVEWEAQRWWAGPEPDGFDWQDEADRRGILVSVPADEAHMAEYGDDAEEMFVLRWIAARESDAEEPTGGTPVGVDCPECGEVFRMDGDGCCVTCGTAIPGYGADAENSGGEGGVSG